MATAIQIKAAGWRLLKWFSCGLLFATAPFVFSWWELSHHFHQRVWFYQLWSHGELSLLSLAIGADGFGESIFRKVRGHPVSTVAATLCALLVAMSTFLFGQSQVIPSSAVSDIQDYSVAQMVICGTTIICAAVAKAMAEN